MRRYLLSVGYFWAIFTCQDFMPGVWWMMCTFHFLLLHTVEASSPASFLHTLVSSFVAQGLLIEIGCSGSSPEFTSIHHEGVVNLSKLRFIPWRKQAWKSFMNNFPFLGSSCCSSFFVGFWFCCFMKNGGYDFCSIAPPTTNVSIISKEQSRWTNPLDFAWMNPWIKALFIQSIFCCQYFMKYYFYSSSNGGQLSAMKVMRCLGMENFSF